MRQLLILLQNQHAACYTFEPIGRWDVRTIKGEMVVDLSRARQHEALRPLLKELSDQFNDEHALRDIGIYVLYDAASNELLHDVAASMKALQCTAWEVLRLEPRLAQAGRRADAVALMEELKQNDTSAQRWLLMTFLPMMQQTCGMVALKSAPEMDVSSFAVETSNQTHTQKASLDANAKQLKERISLLESQLHSQSAYLEGEQLLAFLPALYQQAFTVLNGTDLAMLIGRVEPFSIASPYQEPGMDALHRKQREFLQLPLEQQRRIVAFAHNSSKKLRVRGEMRDHLRRLDGE